MRGDRGDSDAEDLLDSGRDELDLILHCAWWSVVADLGSDALTRGRDQSPCDGRDYHLHDVEKRERAVHLLVGDQIDSEGGGATVELDRTALGADGDVRPAVVTDARDVLQLEADRLGVLAKDEAQSLSQSLRSEVAIVRGQCGNEFAVSERVRELDSASLSGIGGLLGHTMSLSSLGGRPSTNSTSSCVFSYYTQEVKKKFI